MENQENYNDWEQKAYQCWLQADYAGAAKFYDLAILARPDIQQNYWLMGLMYLLAEKEPEAQRVWQEKLADDNLTISEPEQRENWLIELISILDAEAERQKTIAQFKTAWLIRNHILKLAEKLLAVASPGKNQAIAYHLMIKLLLESGGNWEKARQLYQEYQKLLEAIATSCLAIESNFTLELMATLGFQAYFGDFPEQMHQFNNEFARFYCQKVRAYFSDLSLEIKSNLSLPEKPDKILKIGYLSSGFNRHSVGWLVRWIFKYHNREKYQIYAYNLGTKNDDLKYFFENIQQDTSNFIDVFNWGAKEIAELIARDEIDILVDLDSITHRFTSPVLALKPAAIQITWLGYDASGLPTIDYFIADPYVLPETASDYYAQKIWRLPNVYVAVDGFEVGIPTIRRDSLGIPNDAVVYFSSQTGYKRNPENVKLQLRIIKQVKNSYFLIKNLGDEASMREFFEQLAAEEDVDTSRLRFLPQVSLEEIHRANLGIADVVLDTYPYNGATNTLETLWMGIPLVTRVGEQFAARNSYTMMVNAGITEGIAWSDEAYVEWGIKLGQDSSLRQEISWKLLQGRQTKPLWNAKQFTREMENAYEQMWQAKQKYLKSQF
jgi:predicted O-linked N-acetylglucosamine transferase (SPINDLY family)